MSETAKVETKLGIVGAGTMGRGIALACLVGGCSVTLSDTTTEALDKAERYIAEQLDAMIAKQRISAEQAMDARRRLLGLATSASIHADATIVIESVIEDRAVKIAVLSELESVISPTAILGTNTSSISINSLAAPLKNPGRFLGIHFFNPAHVMKLVEIVPSLRTESVTVEQTLLLIRQLGKVPIVVSDVPGFVVNRVVRNYYNEALRLVTEGAATFDQVDRLMESAGFRMGPFRLMDLIGNDVNLRVTESIYEQYYFEPRFRPSPLQRAYVDAGLLGRKTGRGFYSYDNPKG